MVWRKLPPVSGCFPLQITFRTLEKLKLLETITRRSWSFSVPLINSSKVNSPGKQTINKRLCPYHSLPYTIYSLVSLLIFFFDMFLYQPDSKFFDCPYIEEHSMVGLLVKIKMVNTIYFCFWVEMWDKAPMNSYTSTSLHSFGCLTFNLEDTLSHRSMKIEDF